MLFMMVPGVSKFEELLVLAAEYSRNPLSSRFIY